MSSTVCIKDQVVQAVANGTSLAVTPDEAARSLVLFADGLDMSKSGEFWAPRGAKDIGTAKEVLGKDLPTPLQLPW